MEELEQEEQEELEQEEGFPLSPSGLSDSAVAWQWRPVQSPVSQSGSTTSNIDSQSNCGGGGEYQGSPGPAHLLTY